MSVKYSNPPVESGVLESSTNWLVIYAKAID